MVAAGALVREATIAWTAGAYFVTLIPSVIASTLLWGGWHGIVALGLSLLTGWWLTARDSPMLGLDDPIFVFRAVGYLFVGGGCIAALVWVQLMNARLRQANAHLELLYRELEHRVANTMQVAASMLHRLRPMMADPAAKQMIDETVQRIIAMARLHHRAQHADEAGTSLEQMLHEAMADLFGGEDAEVRIAVAPTAWSVGQKTVLLLLVHEAGMNALKYAVRAGERLVFEVALQVEAEGRAHLSIRDNGPGLPVTGAAVLGVPGGGAGRVELGQAELARPHLGRVDAGQGMGIIGAFAEQLGGVLHVGPGPGLSLRVAFPVEAAA